MDARVWEIITEAFGKVLIAGIQVTIPMTILSFAFGLLIAVIVALIQYLSFLYLADSWYTTSCSALHHLLWTSCSWVQG